MPNNGRRSDDKDRYAALKREAAALGFIRRGSVVKRFMPCGKSGCRCQATPPELHGPYYQWTRKVRGKTVTVRLRPDLVTLIEEWVGNGHQLDKLITQMENLSLRITDRILADLKRESDKATS